MIIKVTGVKLIFPQYDSDNGEMINEFLGRFYPQKHAVGISYTYQAIH